jgi:hypothetical protein
MKIDNNEFIETSPEYYLDKKNELNEKYRIEFVATKEYIEKYGSFWPGIKIGDKGSNPPKWPIEPKEAFELFKNYYAKEWFLVEVSGFLNNYYTWNNRAMQDELKKIIQFIDNTKDIDLKEAYEYPHKCGLNESYFLKLANGYYNKKHIEYDSSGAKLIYGKYFLFKELLEKKLGVSPVVEVEEQEKDKEQEKTDHSELLKQLSKYITGINAIEFTNIIEYHSITDGTPRANWNGQPADAFRFAKHENINMSNSAFHKYFKEFPKKNGNETRKLHNSDKNENCPNSELTAILDSYFSK